jgi:1-acyl-sn-glycerol-3-phosphate acyltransferase
MFMRSSKVKKMWIPVLISIFGLSGLILFQTRIMSLLAFLQDQQAISAWFQRIDPIGSIVLFLLMVFQIFVAILPGQPLMLAGGYIFGAKMAVFITAISSILGSQLAFWLARSFGRKLVERLVNQADLERWNRISKHQGTLFFFTTMVVPFLPSDLMCYLAGLGSIPRRKFLAANICGRSINAMMITLLGAYGFTPPWQYWVLIPGSIVLFVIAWLFTQKTDLESDWRPRLAQNASLWLFNTYRRLCSIRLQVHGLENLPAGTKILAANHPNCSDAFLLFILFKGKLKVLAQASQFRQPILGWLFTHTGQIPVYKDRRQEAFQQAYQALSRGETLLIFPEGRLNPDHQEFKINTGAVRLSLISGAPIIPIGMHARRADTVDLNRFTHPPQSIKLWQVRGSLFVNFGEAWRPFENGALTVSADEIHTVTGSLMEKIHSLENQGREECEYENSHNGSGIPAHDKRSSHVFLPSGRNPR